MNSQPELTREFGDPPVKLTTPENSASMDMIMERLKIYEEAVVVAKEKGEKPKARRYQRAIDSMNTMAKQVSIV